MRSDLCKHKNGTNVIRFAVDATTDRQFTEGRGAIVALDLIDFDFGSNLLGGFSVSRLFFG